MNVFKIAGSTALNPPLPLFHNLNEELVSI